MSIENGHFPIDNGDSCFHNGDFHSCNARRIRPDAVCTPQKVLGASAIAVFTLTISRFRPTKHHSWPAKCRIRRAKSRCRSTRTRCGPTNDHSRPTTNRFGAPARLVRSASLLVAPVERHPGGISRLTRLSTSRNRGSLRSGCTPGHQRTNVATAECTSRPRSRTRACVDGPFISALSIKG